MRVTTVSVCFLLLSVIFSCGRLQSPEDVASDSCDLTHLRCTPVKDQGHTEACWIYAYLACVETERIEQYGDSLNLSPMWLVRALMREQAVECYLSQGRFPVSCRGVGPDAERLMQEYGMVPWSMYHPENVNSKAVERDVRGKVKVGVRGRCGIAALNKVVDKALPKLPGNLEGRDAGFYLYSVRYTPRQFGESLLSGVKFRWVTSYTHHPYGEKFVLEIPDNHRRHEFENMPLKDMYDMVVRSLKKGHPVFWEGETGSGKWKVENGKWKVESGKWNRGLAAGKANVESVRQRAFERFDVQDRHAMAIVGLSPDGRSFILKNSYGDKWGNKGYCTMSVSDFMMKTVFVGVPEE